MNNDVTDLLPALFVGYVAVVARWEQLLSEPMVSTGLFPILASLEFFRRTI